MIRCLKCCMPDTRPDTAFVDGVCSACISYARRSEIDWAQRERELTQLLDRYHGECIVPSSGGKDSHWQVLKLLEMGAHVTVITATTCHLTPIGRKNIDNLSRYAKTIEITPSRSVRATLNRLGLQMVGDISWPEHVSIFTTPFNMAIDLGIPLIFYGENPQNQYGGPLGADEARAMTARWRSEFGGFLGLRPADLVGVEGLTEREMEPYMPIEPGFAEAHFLGTYLPWDSHRNAAMAAAVGFSEPDEPPCIANLWRHENLDNAQTGLHDYLMYRKYSYGRGCAQASVDVRTGILTLEQALSWVRAHDGLFPHYYLGIGYQDVLSRIGVLPGEFWDIVHKFDGGHHARRARHPGDALQGAQTGQGKALG